MKLRSLTLANYRCYKTPTHIPFDDFTTFVGRNDCGKSTVLDALDTFFNDKPLDKNDAAKGGNAKAVTITCVFDTLPPSLLLDETATTTLADEHLLNSNGDLEITKIYNCSIEKPKLVASRLRAVHPSAPNADDLLALKVDDLKDRAKALGLNLTGVNKTIKRELRDAIRSAINPLNLVEADILLIGDGVDDKGNSPKVWDGLKSALPLYALFKSDRQSTDQDSEAQDPLKTAVKEAISAKAADLGIVMDYVEQEVKKVAALTLKKLKEIDPAIAATLDPKFEKPNWSSLIKASITGDDEIPLNKRGSGVRRLILLNFFRAKAERAVQEKQANSTIYAIEEPETSQHPHNQRLLMGALQQLAIGDDQVIVTTHTPMLARYLPSSSLRFIEKLPDGSRTITVGGTDAVNKNIADSLGVLPDHSVKVFIVVEGIHDIEFLKALSRVYRAQTLDIPDLGALELAGEVIFVPAGGACNLALWQSRLHKLRRPEFHLFDRDAPSTSPSKHQADVDSVNQRPGCTAVSTSRLELENFVHYAAINVCAQAMGLACNLAAQFGPDDDVPKLLTVELNKTAPQGSQWGPNRVKGWLAGTVVDTMDGVMLAGIDPNNEMLGWMNTIKQMLAQ